jgi:hypothetical protein
VVLYGFETLSLALKEEYRRMVFENMVPIYVDRKEIK